jgi:DNA transformation protein
MRSMQQRFLALAGSVEPLLRDAPCPALCRRAAGPPKLAGMVEPPALVAHCLELLAPLGRVRARRMFGGHGLYVDDLFIALISGERLYLKCDAQSRPAFERAGCTPFAYSSGDRAAVTLSYWSAPDDAMDSPQAMLPWARQAFASALRAQAVKRSPTNSTRRAAPRKARASSARKTAGGRAT